MPQTTLRNAVAYEEWLAEADGDFAWKSFDENTAAGMCYTSGTTGNPKGVLYSHRSNILHSMSWRCKPDMIGLSSRDIALPIVPMFHANSWGLAFSTPMVGSALVMPGAKLDGPSVYELLNDYKVTCTGARADGMAAAAAISGKNRRQAALSAPGRHRRFGLSARHDQDLRGELRRRSLRMPGA